MKKKILLSFIIMAGFILGVTCLAYGTPNTSSDYTKEQTVKSKISNIVTSKEVKEIQSMVYGQSGITFKDLFSSGLADLTWESFIGNDGKKYITIKGNCIYNNVPVVVTVQYKFKTTDIAEFYTLCYNDLPQDDATDSAFFKYLENEYHKLHPSKTTSVQKNATKGTIKYGKHYKYTGQLSNGKPNGKGTIYCDNLIMYIGNVKNGMPDGSGTLMNIGTNNPYYEGQWKNGKKNGKGIEYDNNGIEMFKGQFKNNIINSNDTDDGTTSLTELNDYEKLLQ